MGFFVFSIAACRLSRFLSAQIEGTDAAARFWRIVGFSPRLGHWVASTQWHVVPVANRLLAGSTQVANSRQVAGATQIARFTQLAGFKR